VSIDDRLEAARAEYRTAILSNAPPARRTKSRRPLALMAVVAVTMVAGALIWPSAEEPAIDVTVTEPVDSTAITTTSQPSSAVSTSVVTVEPAGPYVDGQSVTVTPGVDLANGGPWLCVTSTDEHVSCDPRPLHVSQQGGDTAAVVLRQRAFTALGDQDCGDPAIACTLTYRDPSDSPVSSARLTFDGTPTPETASIAVEATARPGTFSVTLDGFEHGPIDLLVPPFALQLWAWGPHEPAPALPGQATTSEVPPPGQPDLSVLWPLVEPAEAVTSFEIELPTEIFGFAGFTDCKSSACALVATGPKVSAAALVPFSPDTPPPVRPQISLDGSGPFVGGDTVSGTVTGLPPGITVQIALCAETPWSCPVVASGAGTFDFTVDLTDELLTNCPSRCSLVMGGISESIRGIWDGLPPPAVVELPVGWRIAVEPAGPYRDGQVITLTVEAGVDVNGAAWCVTTEEGRSCDPRGIDFADPGGSGVRLRQVALTSSGSADCGDPEVTCQVVALDGAGAEVRSAPLRFEGEASPTSATLSIDRADEPGTFVLRPRALAAHPSWTELITDDPAYARDGAFTIELWSWGDPLPSPLPSPTDSGISARVVGQADRSVLWPAPALLDARDPNEPIEVSIPSYVYSYSGFRDCLASRCALVVKQRVVIGGVPGGVLVDEEVVASALIPFAPDDSPSERPSLRIIEPGPHRVGDTITVEVSGLMIDDVSLGIWSGSGPDSDLVAAIPNDGRVNLTIGEALASACGDTCYLGIDGISEGLLPPTVIELQILR
jgi:hypothetical protein